MPVTESEAYPEDRLLNLRREAQDLPSSPGVYLMADKNKEIIYVGKAKVLPRRVSSYFQKTGLTPRISLMVSLVDSFEYVVTATEKEALILESSLIKKHRPRFNVIFRDDKSYPSLRLNQKEDYPYLEIVHRPVKDGSVIFGPFPSVGSLRETVRLVNRLFPLRKCRRPEVKKAVRPCLNYQLGRCAGPCRPEMTKEEYRSIADEVRLFFKGQSKEIKDSLTGGMKEAAERLDFETAAKLRDRLRDLEKTLERQVVAKAGGGDRDVWGLAERGGLAQAAVLLIRDGIVIGCQPVWAEGQETAGLVLLSLLTQFYGRGNFIPAEIWLPGSLSDEDRDNLAGWLKTLSSEVTVTKARGGDGRKIQVMAEENAQAALEERLEKILSTRGVMVELKARLGLDIIPRRIECFDLAHIQGQAPVAGLVVMEEGDFKKDAYRRFKIKTAKGGDDYGGLREVIQRRFQPDKDPTKWARPDLLLIDGGRGQLSAVTAAFEELGVKPPPLAGIAKDRTEGGPDRIFLPGRKNPVDFKPGAAGLMILARLRDEAHRYCRSYHHLLRSKDMLQSLFDGLKNLGPVRKKALIARFVSLEELAQAPDADILAVAPLTPPVLNELRKRVANLLAGTIPRAPGDAEQNEEGGD